MKNHRPSVLLVHGAWHNSATWQKMTPLLLAAGFDARTLDLPGAGVYARSPRSYREQPFDPKVFATEPSPSENITQSERTAAVVSLIEQMRGNVVLVGHSMGGLTISAVAEAVPEKLRALVYVTALMLPPHMPPNAMFQHETMINNAVKPLLCADPALVGALRINPASADPGYRRLMKAAFYTDASDADFASMQASLHCDEPAGVALEASRVTAERFGSVSRHYIRCLTDRIHSIAAQDFMIGAMDSALGTTTLVHDLNSDHAPFLSWPRDLLDVLLKVAE